METSNFKTRIKSITDMSDQTDFAGAGEAIRKGISFKGANVFILACAIIIASLGLNVNSIPVIIGAMLISPVMGPIIGFGFGLGTRDNRLVKDSLFNFGVMVVISIVVSSLFFIISPLNPEKPTELLARTTPTIYDVLIAFFGGFAGILEISRKEKVTVMPGVAIATALMPPLCTVGYGISLMNWHYIFGALYLFVINSIFIALATYITVKYLHYPMVEESDGSKSRLTRNAAALILVAIIVPSVFSAVNIVKDSNFSIKAKKIVESNRSVGQGFIYDYKIDNSQKLPVLTLFMAGRALSAEEKEVVYASAENAGIPRSQIVFHDNATRSQETQDGYEIIGDIYKQTGRQIQALNDSIANLNTEIGMLRSKVLPTRQILLEMNAQYQFITGLTLAGGEMAAVDEESTGDNVVVLIESTRSIDEETEARLERWLKARLGRDTLSMKITVVPDRN